METSIKTAHNIQRALCCDII